MSARKNVQTGFQPVSLDTNFFIYVIYNKHLNNFPINFTIKELIFSSIRIIESKTSNLYTSTK